jgi:hypothetical protein
MYGFARIAGLSLVAAILGYATATRAGPTDTPLPSFSDGKPSLHVYTAVGVIKNNNVETAFICTNVHTAPVHIGVEIFDKTGARANSPPNGIFNGNGAILNVPVGATRTIATSGTALLTEDATIAGLPSLNNGSGRVVATTKNVSCTAMLLDELHTVEDPALSSLPPPTAVDLPLIRVP